jgi:hypothetical protein
MEGANCVLQDAAYLLFGLLIFICGQAAPSTIREMRGSTVVGESRDDYCTNQSASNDAIRCTGYWQHFQPLYTHAMSYLEFGIVCQDGKDQYEPGPR